MNTVMPTDGVKHKWVLLDRDVSEILVAANPSRWAEFVRQDGKILVQMDKLMYGFKEAACYWNKTLIAAFIRGGYTRLHKDNCVLVKRDAARVSMVAITVDDCFFVGTRGEAWREQQLGILRDAFGAITVLLGDEQQIVGMSVSIDRVAKRAVITQKNYARKLGEAYGVAKKSVTPALDDLFGDDEVSELLRDQKSFMSLNSTLMFGSKRTYPEILPAVVKLSSKYNKATKSDYEKAMRVAEYVYNSVNDHKLVLAPKSLQLVASADASYAEHVDGRSHTGGCIGFESDTGCWVVAISNKQPVVAKSSCESELIAVNKIGDYVEWAVQLMEELGFGQETVVIEQDNKCSMEMLRQGTGSFKRAKHIKVRYFWLKELIDTGRVILKYVCSKDLVADILTKPVTGSKFRYLRGKLLGW
jgi:hypothetical protein